MNSRATKPILKAATTALSLSMLLALSACSGDNNTPAEETVIVSEAEPAVESEAATIETPAEADPVIEPIPEAMESAAAEVETADAEPEVVLASDTGAKLYESNCKLCHASGLLNAPIYGDKASWSTALTKDKETLYMHSSQGFNQMPAQAVNGITEAEVEAAVDYMLEAVS